MTKLSSPIGIYSQYPNKNTLMNETFLETEMSVIKYLEDILNDRGTSHNCNDYPTPESKEKMIWHVRYDHWANEDLENFRENIFKLLLSDGEEEDRISTVEILNRIKKLKENK
tara:strand:- start:526 stop:864 length:339 start_codon:yes stop_codon:yes gene_type:complete